MGQNIDVTYLELIFSQLVWLLLCRYHYVLLVAKYLSLNALDTPLEVGYIWLWHGVHHEFSLTRLNLLGYLDGFAGVEHIDTAWEVERKLQCHARQVLHGVRICKYLLAERVKDAIGWRDFELLTKPIDGQEICPRIKICLDGVSHWYWKINVRVECEHKTARLDRVEILVVPESFKPLEHRFLIHSILLYLANYELLKAFESETTFSSGHRTWLVGSRRIVKSAFFFTFSSL